MSPDTWRTDQQENRILNWLEDGNGWIQEEDKFQAKLLDL